MLMEIMLSLLPIGLLQTSQSVSTGYSFARSPQFIHTDVMQWRTLQASNLDSPTDGLEWISGNCIRLDLWRSSRLVTRQSEKPGAARIRLRNQHPRPQ